MVVVVIACDNSVSLLDTSMLHTDDQELDGLEQNNAPLTSNSGWGLRAEEDVYYVDLGRLSRVEAMTVRGRGDANEWVRQVRVSYIVDTDFGDDFWLRVDTNERTEIG